MAGRHVRTLDMTGLSQKGGAVVTDLKVSTTEVEEANTVAPGECELYLGADALAAADGALSPVQQAFKECHGLQCGFCTPGFLTTVTAGLAENPAPTREEAREMVAGNLCRCTGYQGIIAAVLRAAELSEQGG